MTEPQPRRPRVRALVEQSPLELIAAARADLTLLRADHAVLQNRMAAIEANTVDLTEAMNKFTASLDAFVSDNEQGRKVLERMIGNIAANRLYVVAVAVLFGLPAWGPFLWRMMH